MTQDTYTVKGLPAVTIDATDLAIIDLLRQDARLQYKDIGEQVHLTGQAVAGRVRKLQDLGVLTGFTVQVDEGKLGRPLLAFVTVFMKTANHAAFLGFVSAQPAIDECCRVSGEGCYWLKVRVASEAELARFLDRVLAHGNYRVTMSIAKVK